VTMIIKWRNKLSILLHCLLLVSCASAPTIPINPPEQPAQVDPDIVSMPGIGVQGQDNSLVGVKPMTFEELSACSSQIARHNADSDQLKIDNAKLVQRKEALEQETTQRETERLSVDAHNIQQVNDFNKRIEQDRATAIDINAAVTALNGQVSALNNRQNEFNVACANRAYRHSDLMRLPKDLRLSTVLTSKNSDLPLIEDGSAQGKLSRKLHFPVTPLTH